MASSDCNIDFRFTSLESLDAVLASLVPPQQQQQPQVDTSHLDPLLRLAKRGYLPDRAVECATWLAKGHGDMLVVLLEPTDIGSELSPEEVVQISHALQQVDHALMLASKGQRNVRNTCIFDIRPFRSANVREAESKELCHKNDEVAYDCFKDMVDLLQPKVVVICQCSTSDAVNTFAKKMCSSLSSVGNLKALSHGRVETMIVHAFHPSTFREDSLRNYFHYTDIESSLRREISMRRQLLKAAFRLSFVVAMNALCGREVTGFGIGNLQQAIRHNGPVVNPSRRDVASDELIAALEKLQIVDPHKIAKLREREILENLLSSSRRS